MATIRICSIEGSQGLAERRTGRSDHLVPAMVLNVAERPAGPAADHARGMVSV